MSAPDVVFEAALAQSLAPSNWGDPRLQKVLKPRPNPRSTRSSSRISIAVRMENPRRRPSCPPKFPNSVYQV
ncbi:hypothetical protein PoB_004904900 [Plakobranchus ocellatus]|uniref:Uncharacterized protein n=1 Tax=Plakobranchus ocellatus TaxID=259542 RepID=A0AAV4BVV1_9GAST|nr:hypothetical protein PoB_004904900 [Plakobranchus ocellatus]